MENVALIESFSEFKDDKLIDRVTLMAILEKWLTDQGINAQIEEISGSVEIAPGIGLADAICDLVSTGYTLIRNGLVLACFCPWVCVTHKNI